MLLDSVSASASTSAGQTGQASADRKRLGDDLNRFLNLLVTQLQNQDPLDPLDANEFTSQLVQFASVEQQIKQNANLEKLLTAQQNGQVAAMVNYLGTTIEIKGNGLFLENGRAEATYTLPDVAKKTTLTVRNTAGQEVFSTSGEVGTGHHTFSWDGRDARGHALPDGAYTLEVSAQRADGSAIDATGTVIGRVTGTGIDNGKVTLFMGEVAVPIENVLSVQHAREQPVEPRS